MTLNFMAEGGGGWGYKQNKIMRLLKSYYGTEYKKTNPLCHAAS